MTSNKFIYLICLFLTILSSSCNRHTPNLRGPQCVDFKVVNLTPDIIPTEELRILVQNDKTHQYFEFSQYTNKNNIFVVVGREMFSTPQPPAENESALSSWWSHEELYTINILVFRGNKYVGVIKTQMETTKYNYNHITRNFSYTGFKSVVLDSPPHKNEPLDPNWSSTTYRIEF